MIAINVPWLTYTKYLASSTYSPVSDRVLILSPVLDLARLQAYAELPWAQTPPLPNLLVFLARLLSFAIHLQKQHPCASEETTAFQRLWSLNGFSPASTSGVIVWQILQSILGLLCLLEIEV